MTNTNLTRAVLINSNNYTNKILLILKHNYHILLQLVNLLIKANFNLKDKGDFLHNQYNNKKGNKLKYLEELKKNELERQVKL